MEKTPLGLLLKKHRRAAGLTQEKLAAQMGYHSSRISRMESGAEYPSREYIARFILAINLDVTSATVLHALHAKAIPLSEDDTYGDRSQTVTTALPTAWFRLPTGEPHPSHSYYPLLEHERIVAHLVEWLQDPTERPVIALEGAGGLGKTTIAFEAAGRLESAGAFRVLMVSAEYLHSPANPPPLSRRLTYEMVLDRLAQQMELADAANGSLAEKEQLLRAFLQHEPFLILLDNLEDSENEIGIVRAMREMCHPSRVLITTRSRTMDALDFVRPLHLRGLNAVDSAVYLRAESERLEVTLFDELDQPYLDEIHALTVGVPFALKRVVGQVQTWSLETALDNLRHAAHPGDQEFFNSLFAQDWNKLDPAARRIWLFLGRMIPTTISLAHLRHLSPSGGMKIAALERLVSSNLVETGPGITDHTKRYGLHPLARLFLEHVPKLLVLDREQAEFYRTGCVHSAVQLWLDVSAQDETVVRSDAERENILHAVRECFAAQEYAEVIALWERFSTPLYFMGYWNEYRDLDTLTLHAAQSMDNSRVEAEVRSELGWVAMERGELDEAEQQVGAALELFTALQDPLWMLITRRYLATMHMVRNEFERARLEFTGLLADIERDLRPNPAISEESLLRQTAVIHNGLGSVLRELGDLAGSERELALGMEDARSRNPAMEVISLLNLGMLKIKAQDPRTAREYLEQCLALCREHNLRSNAAGALHHLAEVALLEGDRAEALEFAHDAQAIYQRLGAAASERQVGQFIESFR